MLKKFNHIDKWLTRALGLSKSKIISRLYTLNLHFAYFRVPNGHFGQMKWHYPQMDY